MKAYGEGESKVRHHCHSKRRTWRKVHIALDSTIRHTRAVSRTHQDVADGNVLTELLNRIPTDAGSIPLEAVVLRTPIRAMSRLRHAVRRRVFRCATALFTGNRACLDPDGEVKRSI